MRTISLNLILLASITIASSFGANIVVNPNFQNGTLAPWVANTQIDYDWEPNGPEGVNSGCIGAPCVDETALPTANYLYQDLNTVPGTNYDLSFDFASDGSPSELKVLFGGNVVLDVVDPSDSLTRYFVPDLYAPSDSTRVLFLARQDPGFNFLNRVDVEASNVNAAAAAPEPAAMALVIGGVGLLGGLRLRRKR